MKTAKPTIAHADPALIIREISIADAVPVAELGAELGYPLSADTIASRIDELTLVETHILYVACISESVVGWIDVGIVQHLLSGPYCEIGGLVVTSGARNSGVGGKLVAQAELWAAQRGLTKMLVRSRESREDAHRFYLRLQYARTKTSAVFTKSLPAL